MSSTLSKNRLCTGVLFVVGVPRDVVIDPLIEAIYLAFDPSQHLLVFAMLFGVTSIKPGEEPHDRPADTSDQDRHPPRFHKTSVPERRINFVLRQFTVVHIPASQTLYDRENRSEPSQHGCLPHGDTTKQAGPTDDSDHVVAEQGYEPGQHFLHSQLLY